MPSNLYDCIVLPTRTMRIGVALLLFAAAASATLSAEPPEAASINDLATNESTVKVHQVKSPYQRGNTTIRVLLPDKLEPDTRYRCLFVLPVEAADQHRYGDGLQECQRANIHNRYNLICVAPTFSDLPWYADHPTDPQLRQESHITEFVIPYVEERYPVIRSPRGRLLVGFSKSGWGALSLLLRHLELFGGAAAWDAPLMLTHPDKYGTGLIFGTPENFRRYQISRLLVERANQLADGPRIVHSGYGNFRDHHRRAHTLMDRLGISHLYADGPRREHTWHSGWLPQAVERLVADTR